MADTNTVGIFTLNDVRIRQNQNAWANATPIVTVTQDSKVIEFTIDTQKQYQNQLSHKMRTCISTQPPPVHVL
jgi:hypothetical protein